MKQYKKSTTLCLISLCSLAGFAYAQAEIEGDATALDIPGSRSSTVMPDSYSQFLSELEDKGDASCDETCMHAKASDTCALKLYEESPGSPQYVAADKCFRAEFNAVKEKNPFLAATLVLEHKDVFAITDPSLLMESASIMVKNIELTPLNLAYVFNTLTETRDLLVDRGVKLNPDFRLQASDFDNVFHNNLSGTDYVRQADQMFFSGGSCLHVENLFWIFLSKVESLLKNNDFLAHWSKERLETLKSINNYFFSQQGTGSYLGSILITLKTKAKDSLNEGFSHWTLNNIHRALVNKEVFSSFIKKQESVLDHQKTLKEKLKAKLDARKASGNN